MDEELAQKTLAVMRELWPARKGDALYSKEIFLRLIEQGEQIPDGALDQIFLQMKADNVIDTEPQGMNSEGIQRHGHCFITWINPDYL